MLAPSPSPLTVAAMPHFTYITSYPVISPQLDIENHVDLLQDFEVQAVPAVLAFFNGQVVEKFVGLVNEQIVTDFVGRVIGRLNAYTNVQAAQKEPRGDS